MATIVTAFMTNINNIPYRLPTKYIELGKKLLNQPIPTVCFLEKEIYDTYFSDSLASYPYTEFVMFERTDNYLMEYEELLTNFHVNTDNKAKDTPRYMFTQCHKTEWVKMAIERNPFETDNFIWVDFGIFHMIQNDMEFAVHLDKMCKKNYNTIRIPSCIHPNEECNHDIFHFIAWFFAGSLFGGSSKKLLEFSTIMKEFCLNLIKNKKHLMWEINIWYLLHKQHPTLFEPYMANHDITILANY